MVHGLEGVIFLFNSGERFSGNTHDYTGLLMTMICEMGIMFSYLMGIIELLF
jgi:hypothetical protein